MSRYDLGPKELEMLLGEVPRYRAHQLYDGLYRRLLEPDKIHELPAVLRQKLATAEELRPALVTAADSLADEGLTHKWLFSLRDGAQIETVLLHHSRHTTVCISSQAGCAMACSFCATGYGGFSRHLETGEIVEQVVHASRAAQATGRRLDNVVFMGMGEPLANYENVIRAVRRLIEDLGLAQRHLTISTVGVVPGIRRLAAEGLQINLAVSLHAARNELRDTLVPLNRRYPLDVLYEACSDFVAMTRRRISFEWAMIDRVNDTPIDAAELSEIARRLGAHVNLIPLNPTEGGLVRGLRASPPERVRAFRNELLDRSVNVTVRRTRGREIDAACGQLAGSTALALRDR